jgi:glycine dehydrogenase subunit 1
MLSVLELDSVDDLFASVPPRQLKPSLGLGAALSEFDLLQEAESIAERNPAIPATRSFIGAGAYQHFIPSIVDQLAGRGEFATSYTPYQAEASQGTVQSIFEYQTMVSELLGLDVVNASHYDGSTAIAEAALMAVRLTRGRSRILTSGRLHPEYHEVMQTYLEPHRIVLARANQASEGERPQDVLSAIDEETAAVVLQLPDFYGSVFDLSGIAEEVHARGALLILHVDPLAAALFRSPGSLGADIVTGEGQPLGIPVSYGGPYLGIFACRKEYVRRMPGRLAGETVDADGRRGFVLTLNTREQHIRREKATSNICTNQGLMALRAAIYLSALGPKGLRETAQLCFDKTAYAKERLGSVSGYKVVESGVHFREFVLRCPKNAVEVVRRAADEGVLAGMPLSKYESGRDRDLLVCVTELNRREDIDRLAEVLGGMA